MTDVVPQYDNRIAHLIGLIFHPFVVCVPTLLVVLSDIPPQEMLAWAGLIIVILLTPLIVSLWVLKKRGKYVYQRQVRGPIYLIGWLSVLLCLVLTIVFHAPKVLVPCLASLAVWMPLQWAINHWYTKISSHTAVITGCLTGLLMLGDLNTFPLKMLALTVILLTAWARITTRNHTPLQVVLGIIVGALPVVLVFSLLGSPN